MRNESGTLRLFKALTISVNGVVSMTSREREREFITLRVSITIPSTPLPRDSYGLGDVVDPEIMGFRQAEKG